LTQGGFQQIKDQINENTIYHITETNELVNEATATPKIAGNKTRLRPNLSDKRPIIKAPGIHPINSTDCDRLA